MSWNPFSSDLTDNFKANLLLTPVALLFYKLIISFIDFKGVHFDMSLGLVFILIYIYSSRFYQPDLDHRINRPGKAHFPLGKNISVFLMSEKYSLGGVIKIFSFIQVWTARFWYWYWQPFTFFVTHRGITHIPVIGTAVRSIYMYLGINLLIMAHVFTSSIMIKMGKSYDPGIISFLFSSLGLIPFEKILIPIKIFFKSASFLSGVDGYFLKYCLPIYISDLIHELVDLYDSIRRGKAYCSTPSSDWGLIKKIFPKLPI